MMSEEENNNQEKEAAEVLAMVQMARTIAIVFKTFKDEGLSTEEASSLTMSMFNAGMNATTAGPDALEDL